jgi:hypothetical protein
MRAFIPLLAICPMVLFTHCKKSGLCAKGKGSSVTQTIDLAAFTQIELQIDADINVTPDTAQSVSVTAQQNIIDRLDLHVTNGKLVIDQARCYSQNNRITVDIRVPNLQSVELDAPGSLVGTGTFAGQRMDITHKGAGNITLDLDYDLLVVAQESEGDITVSGQADLHQVTYNGSGLYEAFNLGSDTCELVSNGTGDAHVLANQLLDVKIWNAGNVHYKGFPTIVQEITGTGQLINAN